MDWSSDIAARFVKLRRLGRLQGKTREDGVAFGLARDTPPCDTCCHTLPPKMLTRDRITNSPVTFSLSRSGVYNRSCKCMLGYAYALVHAVLDNFCFDGSVPKLDRAAGLAVFLLRELHQERHRVRVLPRGRDGSARHALRRAGCRRFKSETSRRKSASRN